MAFSIKGFLGLDSSGFDRSIEKANAKSSAFANNMKSRLVGAFGVTAIIAGLKKIDDQMKALVDRATEIKQGASRSGLDPTTYQQFDNVLKSTSMSADRAFNSMERLAEAVHKVKQGEDVGGKLAASFALFGVTMDDLKRKEYQQIFFQIADAMKGMDINSENMSKIGDLLGGKAGDLVAAMKVGFNGPVANRGLLDDRDLAQLERLKQIGEEARGPWKALWQEILLGLSSAKESALAVGSHMLSPNATGSKDHVGDGLQARLNAAKQERAEREVALRAAKEKQQETDKEAAKIQQAFAARKNELVTQIAAERFSLLTNEEKLFVLQKQAEVLREMGKNADRNTVFGMENRLALLQNANQQRGLMGQMDKSAGATATPQPNVQLTNLQQIGARVSFNPMQTAIQRNTAEMAKLNTNLQNANRRERPDSNFGGVIYGP